MIGLFGNSLGYKVNNAETSILLLNYTERQNPTAKTLTLSLTLK